MRQYIHEISEIIVLACTCSKSSDLKQSRALIALLISRIIPQEKRNEKLERNFVHRFGIGRIKKNEKKSSSCTQI
jgi:hypothetical protein